MSGKCNVSIGAAICSAIAETWEFDPPTQQAIGSFKDDEVPEPYIVFLPDTEVAKE